MTAPKPRRRAIRFAIVAVVCLLLGAVTTLSVARLIQKRSSVSGGRRGVQATWFSRWRDGADAVAWPTGTPPGWPPPQEFEKLRGLGYSRDWVFRDMPGDWGMSVSPPKSHYVLVERIGWPLRALGSALYINRDDPQPLVVQPIPVLQPLFAGFALDTALYASAWSLLLFTPLPLYRAGRRRFRVSRGMCPACAYDLKGSPAGPCPECGTGAGVKA